MDIVAYLRMLRRHWRIIVAATAIGALVGVATTLLPSAEEKAPRTYYKATHTLFLDTSNITGRYRPVYSNLDQMAVLVTTGDVPRAVAGQLGGDPDEWTSRVFTITNASINTLDITCADPTADGSVTCAEAFAAKLVSSLEAREETRFNAERDEALARLDSLEGQIAQLDGQIAAGPGGVDILQAQRRSLVNSYSLAYEAFQQLAEQGGPVSLLSTLENAEAQPIDEAEYASRIAQGRLGLNRARADLPQDVGAVSESSGSGGPQFSGPVSRGTLGGLIGLLLGVGLAVVADRADRRLRTREEVEAAYGMPVLAEVPELTSGQQKDRTIESVRAPLSRSAEAYRAVRSSLMFQQVTDGHHRADDALVVLVGSAGPKEGKTTTSANLATLFAETGARVLAINCDFRRPTLHHYFDLPNEPRRVFDTEIPGLWVVTDVASDPSGANPAVAVEEQRQLVAAARKRFDVIVLDTAPLLTTNDATELMSSADLVVLTCRQGTSTADGAHRVRELLSRIAAPVSGVVLLGSQAASNDYYYYYSHRDTKTAADAPSASREGDDLFGPEPTVPTVPTEPTQPDGHATLGTSTTDRPIGT